ncbi:unnamed protein product [Amoebophrya sp. A25]|nr:unnamed protein product [Amoebophrya sp. A25]|eukprot:GSA25T00000817001.1
MSIKHASRGKTKDGLALIPYFYDSLHMLECSAPQFQFTQHAKEDKSDSNGKWQCHITVMDTGVGKEMTYTHEEGVTQKKHAQELAIIGFFAQRGAPLDLSRFHGLGEVEGPIRTGKPRVGRAAEKKEAEVAMFKGFEHLAKPPGAETLIAKYGPTDAELRAMEYDAQLDEVDDSDLVKLYGGNNMPEQGAIPPPGGIGGIVIPPGGGGQPSMMVPGGMTGPPGSMAGGTGGPSEAFFDPSDIAPLADVMDNPAITGEDAGASSSATGDDRGAEKKEDAEDEEIDEEEALRLAGADPADVNDEPELLDLGLEAELGLPSASATSKAGGKVIRATGDGGLKKEVVAVPKATADPPPAVMKATAPPPPPIVGPGLRPLSSAGLENLHLATQRAVANKGGGGRWGAYGGMYNNMSWGGSSSSSVAGSVAAGPNATFSKAGSVAGANDDAMSTVSGYTSTMSNWTSPWSMMGGPGGSNKRALPGTHRMQALPREAMMKRRKKEDERRKDQMRGPGVFIDREDGTRVFRTKNGVDVPEPIMDIQGLWVLLDPHNRPVGASGPGTFFNPADAADQGLKPALGQQGAQDGPDSIKKAKVFVVEENAFRASNASDRQKQLIMADDGSPEFVYVDDNENKVRGLVQNDQRTNNKIIHWDNGDQWEPAVTPLLPEEKDDEETYGFDLCNGKQNLNIFFQKRKFSMETIVTDPLTVVPGFRGSVDMMVNSRERLRCSVVSGSKKGAGCELAMRVCKMLCRRKMIPKASEQGAGASTPEALSITPETFGLSQHMRGVLKKFVTDTCNFSPVEFDQQASVIDVALKIDAAPWSMSANYESEGAIAWTEPRACPDPWGSTQGGGGPSAHARSRGNMYGGDSENQKLLRELQQKQGNHLYQMMQHDRTRLPIWNMQHEIVREIEGTPVVLVQGSTGCGKTTQIPQFLLDYYIGRNKGVDCNIIVTQPRRVAAISVAERVAQERGEALGTSVGYMVRFDQVSPRPSGSMVYMTVGVLLKRLAAGLHGISHVIIDEVHERDVNTDFLLIVLRRLIGSNPRLRVVLMSATIDLQKLQLYFARRNTCRIIDVPGRTFPVTCYYLEDAIELLNWKAPKRDTERRERWNGDIVLNPNMRYSEDTEWTVRSINENELQLDLIEKIIAYIIMQDLKGGVLIFLAGWDEIARCLKHLRRQSHLQSCYFLPLHSQVPKSEQHLVFQNPGHGRTKVVLATNIAETSVTIPDVSYVIDTCKCKMKYFRPVHDALLGQLALGDSSSTRAHPLMSRMDIHWAAKHNLIQRMGRAGRTHSGVCFRLCTKWRFDQLPDIVLPEIQRVPLHQSALMVKWLRLGEISAFLGEALDPPSQENINRAIQVLQELYAIDQFQRLTPLGVQISKLPIEPRMGYAVLLSCLLGVAHPMCVIAAASCYQDPVRQDSPLKSSYSQNPNYSDQILLLKILYQLHDTQKYLNPNYCRDNGVNGNVVRIIFDSAKQLELMLQQMGFDSPERVPWNKARWDQLQLLLALSVDHFSMHHSKRRVWLGPMETGVIQQSSCCADEVVVPPERFYVFEEQSANSSQDTKTFKKWKEGSDAAGSLQAMHSNVQCRNVTNVSVIPIILGSAMALTYSQKHLYIDGWLPLRCTFETAALLGALKACLESLVLRLAHTPRLVSQNDAPLIELRQVLSQICDSNIKISPDEEEQGV